MGKLSVSVESGDSDSDNENSDVGSEEVSEEEPSEEPVEEDPDEDDEAQEVDSCEETVKDSCGPNEENLCKQELDEVASCEVDPNEEDSSEEDYIEHVSREEEQHEDSCEEEPYEEDEQLEETLKEPCEEVEDVEESCEVSEEPSEEEPDEEPIEEPDEEPIEEETDEEPAEHELEKGPVEEESDEEEQSEDSEEDPSEDKPSGGSPVNQSYSRNNDESSQPNSRKMNMPSDIMPGPKRIHEPSGIQSPSNNKNVPEKLATIGNTGRKRRSRWDIVGEAKELTEASGSMTAEKGKTQGSRGSKKKKKNKKTRWSRWSNDNSQISTASPSENPTLAIAQEISKLGAQLLQITNKLQSGVVDDRPESERSPSPPPIYNNLGIKINTREARLRSKLITQRQTIISELMRKNPNFKPPPDYKSAKHQKKIYIPTKEYPGYNFIGLILGPRGNTHKRMERETGAKILLRGKGSVQEGKVLNDRPELSDDENLHVVVEADNGYSLDAAVAMVEKLLVPVGDGHNVHKLAQLRELAELKGTLRFPSNYRKPDPCNVCGDADHPTSACPLTAPASGTSSNSHQVNFFAEMGGGLSSFTAPPLPVPTTPPVGNLAAPVSNPNKEIDDANLFVGHLPHSVAETKLMELFFPFGPICQAKVVRDKITGLSKGYGFVRYTDHVNAAKAVAQMNGYKIEGKTLVVRIAGILPPPVNQLPTYSGPPTIPQKNNPDPMHWPGPPESRLSETVAPFSNTSYLPVHDRSFSGQYSASLAPSFQTPKATSLFSGDFTTSDELAHFPGYLKSLDPPSQLYHQSTTPSSSLSSSQVHYSQNFGGYHMPPT